MHVKLTGLINLKNQKEGVIRKKKIVQVLSNKNLPFIYISYSPFPSLSLNDSIIRLVSACCPGLTNGVKDLRKRSQVSSSLGTGNRGRLL